MDPEQLPFYGFDCWNHYEFSWLNESGKPVVAIAEIIYDCATPYLIESKSLKLYFNSFNNTRFKNSDVVRKTVIHDLATRLGAEPLVRIVSLREPELCLIQAAPVGECIDDLDVTCSVYSVEPNYLSVGDNTVTEILYSDLLKSNCLVTNQPDWVVYKLPMLESKLIEKGYCNTSFLSAIIMNSMSNASNASS